MLDPAALPPCFAHRCGGALAPENTLLGLERAAAAGFSAVEFDVMLSADGTPFLIHDETLERTTNGRGPVSATPDRVLMALDAGDGETIPTLAEAAARCLALGLLANVEIKPATGAEARTGAVVAQAVRDLWRGCPVLLSSFSGVALDAARSAASELPRGLLFDTPPSDWLAQWRALDGFSLHIAWSAVSRELLAATQAAGVPLLCYTVNRPEDADRLLSAGVAAVFTDAPEILAVASPGRMPLLR